MGKSVYFIGKQSSFLRDPPFGYESSHIKDRIIKGITETQLETIKHKNLGELIKGLLQVCLSKPVFLKIEIER